MMCVCDIFDMIIVYILQACCDGTLSSSLVSWRENVSAVGVILASHGYPASSSKGQVITGIDEVARKRDYFVFHSGTAVSSEGELVTNGKKRHSKGYINKCLSI